MNEHQPGMIDATGADLEYDLAHEASGVGAPAPRGQLEQGHAVPTATPQYDGDYSYDLAHDIPGRESS